MFSWLRDRCTILAKTTRFTSLVMHHSSHFRTRKEPRPPVAVRQDSLDVDIRFGALGPEFDEDVSPGSR